MGRCLYVSDEAHYLHVRQPNLAGEIYQGPQLRDNIPVKLVNWADRAYATRKNTQ